MERQEYTEIERRAKARFPMNRELRYKLLEDQTIVESGMGRTVNMGSGGVGFQIDHSLQPGTFIELSISWPVLLDDSCAMRLIVFGRVVRSWSRNSACRVEKYEFRTQSRAIHQVVAVRTDSMLQRWADGMRKEGLKENQKAAGF